MRFIEAFVDGLDLQAAGFARVHAKTMGRPGYDPDLLKRWKSFTRSLDDGRVCLPNNAAERGLRGIAFGRRSWLFCGSDRGGQRAAAT